jgi:hypothetical protein
VSTAERPLSPHTVAVTAGRPEGPGAPLNTPIVLASNFREGGDYGRNESMSGADRQARQGSGFDDMDDDIPF